mgnify:CR=1 FL=1
MDVSTWSGLISGDAPRRVSTDAMYERIYSTAEGGRRTTARLYFRHHIRTYLLCPDGSWETHHGASLLGPDGGWETHHGASLQTPCMYVSTPPRREGDAPRRVSTGSGLISGDAPRRVSTRAA